MKTSDRGIELIKQHEALRLKAYKCPAGVWTIGYGHTRTACSGLVITEREAVELLRSDLQVAEAAVGRGTNGIHINQNQFDALVSFVFNVGSGAFLSSTLLRKIRALDTEKEIRHEFSRWNKGGGKVLPGLMKRRQQEADLYFSP